MKENYEIEEKYLAGIHLINLRKKYVKEGKLTRITFTNKDTLNSSEEICKIGSIWHLKEDNSLYLKPDDVEFFMTLRNEIQKEEKREITSFNKLIKRKSR